MVNIHRWPIEMEVRTQLTASLQWYAKRLQSVGYTYEFHNAPIFFRRDDDYYRIGINAAVLFAPNLYPILSRIPLPFPCKEEEDTPTTKTSTYEKLAVRHKI